jgi:hypothetical protein
MPRTTAVRVEPPEVEGMVKTLLTVYAAKAEALAHAAIAYADGREPPAALEEARRELAAAADALDALGWTLGPRLEAGELAGETGLVREVLYAALLDAAEEVGEACLRYEAAEIDLAALRGAVDRLGGRLALFAAHEEREGR